MLSNELFAELESVLEQRLSAEADDSYVASLNAKGLDAILKKIGEEATETVMAAKDGDADKIVSETADLWFHCMILLVRQGLSAQNVVDELARRMGKSGLVEKAERVDIIKTR